MTDLNLFYISESELTKEKLEKWVLKNTYPPAIIHRNMCTKNSDETRENNRELYDICANKYFKREDVRKVYDTIQKKIK